jgi:hypothetical protein
LSLLLLFNQPLPWHQVLLDTAEQLHRDGHHEVAVVTSIMACETATERALAHFFNLRGLQHLREPIEAFYTSYNLSNERLRKLYVALSGDEIQTATFWPRYKASAKVRHSVVHNGARASTSEASDAVSVAAEFVRHMVDVMKPKD